jgi:SseB protein N-terminal domain
VSGLSGGEHRFRGDDGSADPRAAAALAAFASGSGTEHAALTSLAASRLLVPVVATPAEDLAGHRGGEEQACAPGHHGTGRAICGPMRAVGGAEKASEMALAALVGADGRRAVAAFTSLAALIRWRPGARPVPTEAAAVWRAAAADSCAVVIDIAGPVPLAIEGARLAALARGEAVPLPHQDPDVRRAVETAIAALPGAALPGGARVSLGPGDASSDLVIHLVLPAGCDGARTADLAGQVGASVMARLGGRLRRGIAFAVSPAAGDGPA